MSILIKKTYNDDKNDYKNYKYEKSLYLDLTTNLLTGGIFGSSEPLKQNEINNKNPKMNYYKDKNNDYFVIRGSDDIEDLITDSNLILQDSIREIIKNPAIDNKEKQLIKFINQNRRKDKGLILSGHSLGSHHANKIHEKFPKSRLISFGHAGLYISPEAEAVYSYNLDPFYRPTNKKNHIILNKNPSSFFHNPFNEFHSIQNFINKDNFKKKNL